MLFLCHPVTCTVSHWNAVGIGMSLVCQEECSRVNAWGQTGHQRLVGCRLCILSNWVSSAVLLRSANFLLTHCRLQFCGARGYSKVVKYSKGAAAALHSMLGAATQKLYFALLIFVFLLCFNRSYFVVTWGHIEAIYTVTTCLDCRTKQVAYMWEWPFSAIPEILSFDISLHYFQNQNLFNFCNDLFIFELHVKWWTGAAAARYSPVTVAWDRTP